MRLFPILLACGLAVVAAPLLAATRAENPAPEIKRDTGAPQAVGAAHTRRTIPEACARLEGVFTGEAEQPLQITQWMHSPQCQPRVRYVDYAKGATDRQAGNSTTLSACQRRLPLATSRDPRMAPAGRQQADARRTRQRTHLSARREGSRRCRQAVAAGDDVCGGDEGGREGLPIRRRRSVVSRDPYRVSSRILPMVLNFRSRLTAHLCVHAPTEGGVATGTSISEPDPVLRRSCDQLRVGVTSACQRLGESPV